MQSIKTTILALAFCALCVPDAQAQEGAPWFFGIGTGIARLSADGEQGFHAGEFGGVVIDIDLAPRDFDDYIQSAFGFGGYATNGTWMVQFSLGSMELGEELGGGTLPGGAIVTSDLSFDLFSTEALVGRTVYRSAGNRFALRPHIGIRHMRHELAVDLTITDAGVSTDISRGIKQNWTDFLVGTSMDIKLKDNWGWNILLDAGFGGSEGTYRASTGWSWQIARHWSLSPNVSFMAIDYQNGVPGDVDFYLYDVNEFSYGLSFLFHF